MKEGGEKEDRISSLPDGLVVEILSRLPSTKYAIRTGILSKRWRHVHKTLIFQTNDINVSMEITSSLPNFLSSVNKTITQCQSKNLNKFYLHSTFRVGFESQLNDFIRYAINCNAQELYLKLGNLDNRNKFELKDDMFFNNSCVTHLDLAYFVISPSGVISWNNLKSLCVYSLKLDEDLIQKILSGSPLLETLKLKFCCGFRRLDITSKRVKNLVVSGYDRRSADIASVDVIEINAPIVLSLTLQNPFALRKILLLDVSCLVKACLNYTKRRSYPYYEEEEDEMLEEFILKLHHVKELQVGKHFLEVLSRLEDKGLRLPSGMKYVNASPHSGW